MVKFSVKANHQGQYYLPKEVREELGEKLDLICNARAAIIFNSDTSLDQVLKSLDVLMHDLRNRYEIEKIASQRLMETERRRNHDEPAMAN
jgi:bifunctional DNA-binding transcriptional regulator/antitoxin component of YhaV-PrlF toxin-antitoxin module